MRLGRRHSVACEPRDQHRGGSVTLEFIVAFPIVLIASVAIMQFLFLAIVIEGSATAVNEGAREGAELYPDMFPITTAMADNDIVDNIIQVMNEHLNVYKVEIVDTANNFPDDAQNQNAAIRVDYVDDMGGLTTVYVNTAGVRTIVPMGGSTAPCPAPIPAPGTNEIVVTLCFELVDGTPADDPIPDWLQSVGFSLNGCSFEMAARQSLE